MQHNATAFDTWYNTMQLQLIHLNATVGLFDIVHLPSSGMHARPYDRTWMVLSNIRAWRTSSRSHHSDRHQKTQHWLWLHNIMSVVRPPYSKYRNPVRLLNPYYTNTQPRKAILLKITEPYMASLKVSYSDYINTPITQYYFNYMTPIIREYFSDYVNNISLDYSDLVCQHCIGPFTQRASWAHAKW